MTHHRALPDTFGHLSPQECRELDGEAARILAYARCVSYLRPDGRSLVARVAAELGLAPRTVEKALLRIQARGFLRLRRGARGKFEIEPAPAAPSEEVRDQDAELPTPNVGSGSLEGTTNPGSRSGGVSQPTANVRSPYREPAFALSEKREEERDLMDAPPRKRGRRAGEVIPLAAFPEGRARAFVAAIREYDHPAWRHDPKVTPDWVDRVLALGPGIDAVHLARRAAAWWAERPVKTRHRASCTGTIRTFLERAAESPDAASSSRADPGPRCTGAAGRGLRDIEAAAREREKHPLLTPTTGGGS